MKIMKLLKCLTLAATLGGSLLATTAVTPAQATPILSFGQSGNVNLVTGTRNNNTTQITATNAGIVITQIDAAIAAPLSALLSFTFNSTSAAVSVAGFITQNYSGTFCITSAAACGGTNYLSGSLIDVAFGQNAAFNLNASTPPAGSVLFNSGVISPSELGLDRGAGISFAAVTPGLSIVNGTINSFTSSVSGTFSANNNVVVPEPFSIAMLGVGLIGLGAIRRRAA